MVSAYEQDSGTDAKQKPTEEIEPFAGEDQGEWIGEELVRRFGNGEHARPDDSGEDHSHTKIENEILRWHGHVRSSAVLGGSACGQGEGAVRMQTAHSGLRYLDGDQDRSQYAQAERG